MKVLGIFLLCYLAFQIVFGVDPPEGRPGSLVGLGISHSYKVRAASRMCISIEVSDLWGRCLGLGRAYMYVCPSRYTYTLKPATGGQLSGQMSGAPLHLGNKVQTCTVGSFLLCPAFAY